MTLLPALVDRFPFNLRINGQRSLEKSMELIVLSLAGALALLLINASELR